MGRVISNTVSSITKNNVMLYFCLLTQLYIKPTSSNIYFPPVVPSKWAHIDFPLALWPSAQCPVARKLSSHFKTPPCEYIYPEQASLLSSFLSFFRSAWQRLLWPVEILRRKLVHFKFHLTAKSVEKTIGYILGTCWRCWKSILSGKRVGGFRRHLRGREKPLFAIKVT